MNDTLNKKIAKFVEKKEMSIYEDIFDTLIDSSLYMTFMLKGEEEDRKAFLASNNLLDEEIRSKVEIYPSAYQIKEGILIGAYTEKDLTPGYGVESTESYTVLMGFDVIAQQLLANSNDALKGLLITAPAGTIVIPIELLNPKQ